MNADLIEELESAAKELRATPPKYKGVVESLTGVSFDAIAFYTERAAAALKDSIPTTPRELTNGMRGD